MKNEYITYLNSLHNISPSGSNALAESQALNQYFSEVYTPFPIVENILAKLTDGEDKVIILTGHAGDGKSTVALDVFKQLKNISSSATLSKPMEEREIIRDSMVTIIKDMSELGAERRKEWISDAFTNPGSSLIISNTGPLFDSLMAFSEEQGRSAAENRILEVLDKPVDQELSEVHAIDDFAKKLYILNLTRLDNIEVGTSVLGKMINHTGWNKCAQCPVKAQCSLNKNQQVISNSIDMVEERVRQVYTRLSAYEHRLTFRQIIAHLAFSITGGRDCNFVFRQLERGMDELELWQSSLFSEQFFGMRDGKPLEDAAYLHAISLLRKENYGAPAGIEFERSLVVNRAMEWADIPPSLMQLSYLWKDKVTSSEGTRWRCVIRRMHFIHAHIKEGNKGNADRFIDNFLLSPSVRHFRSWARLGDLDLNSAAKRRLTEDCLRVLLEFFTGFSANQYGKNNNLYLTLRRKDQKVVQPTQLVIGSLPFRNFELKYDKSKKQPVLSYKNDQRSRLALSLPLFDFIKSRSQGLIEDGLSPIHQAEIDYFQSSLMQIVKREQSSGDDSSLIIIKAGINGEVSEHEMLLEENEMVLEVIK
jgi:hypothetical protein